MVSQTSKDENTPIAPAFKRSSTIPLKRNGQSNQDVSEIKNEDKSNNNTDDESQDVSISIRSKTNANTTRSQRKEVPKTLNNIQKTFLMHLIQQKI